MPDKLSRKLISIWESILVKAKRITLPGLDGMALYDVMVFFWRSIVDGALSTRASSTYYLSVYPYSVYPGR